MTDLREIFEVAGPAYLERHGQAMLPSHVRAMRDITDCRTPVLGGQLFCCESCGLEHAVYHSCRNRHCPRCQGDKAETWLENQRKLLLPTDYLLATCTLPAELRDIARSHQRIVYAILIRAAALAVIDVVGDPDYIGGLTAVMAVLHTWTRALLYHLHVHLVFPNGGLSEDGNTWLKPKKRSFPVPGYALAKKFRLRVMAAFEKAGLYDQVPAEVWYEKRWVANVKKVGSGDKALLYLSRYVFRVAISDGRIESFDGERVRFKWIDSKTGETRHATLPVNDFISRFLQHVLPRGFVKVRYFGLWAPPRRHLLAAAEKILQHHLAAVGQSRPEHRETSEDRRPSGRLCPQCGAAYSSPPRDLPRARGPP